MGAELVAHAAVADLAVDEQELARPFGTIRRSLAVPAVACLVSIIIFYSRVVDLGTYAVNIPIQFNMNVALGLLTATAGILGLVVPAIRQRSLPWNMVASLIAVAAVAWVVFRGVPPLGTFTYTQETLDADSIIVLALVLACLVLAQRGSRIAVGTLVFITLWWAVSLEDFTLQTFTQLFSSGDGLRLVSNLFPPRWLTFGNYLDPLYITIKSAIVGTLLGVLGALPLSILAARNTTPHPILYNLVRGTTNVVRAVPAFFVALLLVPLVGLGTAPGILALGLHSTSVLTKIFSENIESVRREPLEALNAAGANWLKQFRWGVIPQALPLLASYSLYNFESNVRDSTVLSFVGGGGLGFLLYQDINLLSYHTISVLLALLIVSVMLLDRLSDYLRSRIL